VKKSTIIAALAVALAGVTINSLADTTTANLEVTATVNEVCTITAEPLAFGAGYVTGTNSAVLNGAGAVNTVCTIGTSTAKVTLGNGSNFDTTRRMKANTDFLSYTLSAASSGGAVWASDGEVVGTGTGALATVLAGTKLVVYGQIPAGQNVPKGVYADTVVATVNW